MKALTIWQPWASMIMAGVKPFEFRSWRPPRATIGQRIVIHAGARPVSPRQLAEIQFQLDSDASTLRLKPGAFDIMDLAWRNRDALPLGAGLGTAVVGEPVRQDGWDNWGWPMLEIQPFQRPLPRKGAQGLWNWETPRD